MKMRKKSLEPKKLQRSHVIVAIVSLVILGILAYLAWPFLATLSSPEQAKQLIVDTGVWGPFVFILMQIAQILVAPIPGQVVGLAGGFLFGPWLGLLYAMVGATIGFTLIFVITRKLGRPFVERFVNKKALTKFDSLTETKGAFVFFLIFLLPAFPDDIISFVAGLTTIKIRTLVLVSVLGRLPGLAVLSFTGNGLTQENMNPIVVMGIVMLLLFIVGFWKRAWLREFVKHDNRLQFIKQSWNKPWIVTAMWIIGIVVLGIALYYAATVTPIQQ